MGRHGRKRRRKTRRSREIKKFAGVYFAPHPFNALDKAKLRDALSKIGENAVEKFDTLTAELRHILDSVDALQAIACLATYGLTMTVRNNGDFGTTYKGDEFTQAHVELCIAFALRTSLEKRGTTYQGQVLHNHMIVQDLTPFSAGVVLFALGMWRFRRQFG